MILLVALAVIIAVSASSCSEPDLEPNYDQPGHFLLPGEYRIQVVQVTDLDCGDARAEEFVGQVAWGYLETPAEGLSGPVTFDLEGVLLRGEASPNLLMVAGAIDSPKPEEDEPPREEHDSDDDRDEGADHGDTGAAEPPGDEHEGDQGDGEDNQGQGGGTADRPDHALQGDVSMGVNVVSESSGDGFVEVKTEGCWYRVGVTLQRANGEADAPVATEADTGYAEAQEGDEG